MSSNSENDYHPLTRQRAMTKLESLWLDKDNPNHEKTFYEPTLSPTIRDGLSELFLAKVIKQRAIRKLERYYQTIRDKKTQRIDESLENLIVSVLLPIIHGYNKGSVKRKTSEGTPSLTQETPKKYRT